MVVIPLKEIPINPDEVVRNRDGRICIYFKKIDALPIIAKINPRDYVLIQEGDKADTAISMIQQFGELDFISMIQKSVENGLILSTPRRIIQNIINVNSAAKGETALYDAFGNIIEGDKLVMYANRLNHNSLAYLNGRFPQEIIKDTGHKGLDFLTIGADGSETRAPLETCLDDSCYAELASMNSQGFPTRKDSVQKYSPGKNLYFYPPVLRTKNPEEGYVARFDAGSGRATLNCDWHPDSSDPSLGGILCAEGAAEKL